MATEGKDPATRFAYYPNISKQGHPRSLFFFTISSLNVSHFLRNTQHIHDKFNHFLPVFPSFSKMSPSACSVPTFDVFSICFPVFSMVSHIVPTSLHQKKTEDTYVPILFFHIPHVPIVFVP